MALLTLAGCGEPEPPYLGTWTVDVEASVAASPRMFRIMDAIRGLGDAEITFHEDRMVTRLGGGVQEKSFESQVQDDETFRLVGPKGDAFVVEVLNENGIAVRDPDDIVLILVRKRERS
jgi:hypothetical protein